MIDRLVEKDLITPEEFPKGFELVANLDQVRAILPHGPKRLRVHYVGRMINERFGPWAGLFRVLPEVVEDHFDILPECEFAELLAQTVAVGALLEFGWERIRRLGATAVGSESIKHSKELPGKIRTIQAPIVIRTNDIVLIRAEELMVDCRSENEKNSRLIKLITSGRLIVNGREVAQAWVKGEGVAQATKWVSPIASN